MIMAFNMPKNSLILAKMRYKSILEIFNITKQRKLLDLRSI